MPAGHTNTSSACVRACVCHGCGGWGGGGFKYTVATVVVVVVVLLVGGCPPM